MTTMQQAMHIFKKDVRFLRLEIGAMFAIAAIFAWVGFRSHEGFAIPGDPLAAKEIRLSASLILGFVFQVAGILLIVRAIQAESIPGTRQFWVTRPYQWKSLLIAKALFIVVCVNLPIFLSRTVIVVADGFPLSQNLQGLLSSQFLMMLQVSLPVAVIAALTSGVVPFIFTVLIVLVSAPLIHSGIVSKETEWLTAFWIRNIAEDLLVIGIGIAILCIQYRYRRSGLSMVLGIAAMVLALTVPAWMPLSFAMDLQSKRLASTAGDPAIQISLGPDSYRATIPRNSTDISITLPMELKGVPEGMTALPNLSTVTIENPNDKLFMHAPGYFALTSFSPGSQAWGETVDIRPAFFEAERDKPLTLRVSVYLTLFGNSRMTTVPYETNHWIDVPGGFRCFNGGYHYCESAFKSNSLLVTTGMGQRYNVWEAPTLFFPSYPSFPIVRLHSIVDINPVRRSPEQLLETTIFSVQELVAHIRRDIEIRDFHLTDYANFEN